MRNAKKRTPNLLVVRFNTDFGQAQKQGCEPLGAKSCSNVKGPVCASYVFVTNCVLIGIYVRHWLPQRAALHKFLSANWLLYDFPTENVLFWFFLLFCFTFGFAFLHGQFEMKENDESMTQRPIIMSRFGTTPGVHNSVPLFVCDRKVKRVFLLGRSFSLTFYLSPLAETRNPEKTEKGRRDEWSSHFESTKLEATFDTEDEASSTNLQADYFLQKNSFTVSVSTTSRNLTWKNTIWFNFVN